MSNKLQSHQKKRGFLKAMTWFMLLSGSASACYTGADVEGKNNWFFSAVEYVFNGCEKPEVVQDSVDVVGAVNAAMKARQLGLFVVMVPLKVRIYQDQLPNTVKITAPVLNRYNLILQDLKEKKVNAIDLNSLFLSSKNQYSKYPLYYRADVHWSSQGSVLAAQAIAKQVMDSKLLSASPQVDWIEKRDPATRTPFTHMGVLQVPESKREPYIPIYYQNSDTSGAGLLDAIYPDLVVTGDSFANGDHDTDGRAPFSTAIGYFLHRDVLNAAIPGKGPFYPLLRYVSSDAFQNHPPKAVVWELWEAMMQTYDDGFAYTGKFEDNYYLDMASALLNCQQGGRTAQLPFTPNFDQYLNFRLPAGLKKVAIQVGTPGATYAYDLSDSGDEGNIYNIPLADMSSGPVNSMTLTADGKPVTLPAVQLCTLPAALGNIAALDGRTLNFVTRNYPNQLKFTGLYSVPQASAARWGLNDRSTVQFYAKKAGKISVNIVGTSFYDAQVINLSENGKSVASFKAAPNRMMKIVASFPITAGKNVLTLSYARSNKSDPARATELLKTDPRPLTINFTQFSIHLP